MLLTPERLVICHKVSRETGGDQCKLMGHAQLESLVRLRILCWDVGNGRSIGLKPYCTQRRGKARGQHRCLFTRRVQFVHGISKKERVCCQSQIKRREMCENSVRMLFVWEFFFPADWIFVSEGTSVRGTCENSRCVNANSTVRVHTSPFTHGQRDFMVHICILWTPVCRLSLSCLRIAVSASHGGHSYSVWPAGPVETLARPCRGRGVGPKKGVLWGQVMFLWGHAN